MARPAALALRLGLAAGVIHLALSLPGGRMAAEGPLVLLLLAATERGARLVTAGLMAGLVLRAADLAMQRAFARSFNPATDLGLAAAGWQLASGAMGEGRAGAALLALAAGGVLAYLALLWAARQWQGARQAPGAALALIALAAIALIPPWHSATAPVLRQAQLWQETRGERLRFLQAARNDPLAGRAGLLDLLRGRDTRIVFVESYGRASFDNPLYAPAHLATLRAGAARLRARGYAIRSAWLASPVSGGQSWLAHATLATGLRVSDAAAYAALLDSPRRWLFHLAQGAGMRTEALMPGITRAWPEGARMGFDTILAAEDLGYRGPPFGWVTMPDQFTLAVMGRRRAPPEGRLAQVVLISSHAPWSEPPPLLPDPGDGAAFAPHAGRGDPPEVVWSDADRVRAGYRAALDYSLTAVMEALVAEPGPLPLVFVLGDHPPAAFVSGVPGRMVPVHAIGPPDLVARLAGWAGGIVPPAGLPPRPMEDFRDELAAAFSSRPPT